jgi:hypothetical protein
VIPFVGCLYGPEVSRTGIAAGKVCSTPGEYRQLVDFLNDNIGHETAMPAIAICKAMDAYNAVFEPHRHFIGWICVMFVPVTHIIQQVPQFGRYLPFVCTNILISFTKYSCPSPYISIHASVHHPHKLFGKNDVSRKGTPQSPLQGLFYVFPAQIRPTRPE